VARVRRSLGIIIDAECVEVHGKEGREIPPLRAALRSGLHVLAIREDRRVVRAHPSQKTRRMADPSRIKGKPSSIGVFGTNKGRSNPRAQSGVTVPRLLLLALLKGMRLHSERICCAMD